MSLQSIGGNHRSEQGGIEKGSRMKRAHLILIIGQMEQMNHGGNLTMIEMPAR